MTTGILSFTLSDGTPYSITSTTVNPLTQTPPTSGNWRYFLHYYNNPNGKPDILTCTATDPTKPVYVCAFAQGGAGGKNSYGNTPYGGGGGGGQCFHRQLASPITVTLNPIVTIPPDTTPPTPPTPPTTIQSSTFISSTNLPGVFTLRSGGVGGNGTVSSNIESVGGNGGEGGGAGGSGGGGGVNPKNKNGTGGPHGNDTGTGFSVYNGTNFIASNGNGYNGVGDSGINFNVPSTNQAFSDGTSLPRKLDNGTLLQLAQGGIPGYYSATGDKFYNSQSGNIAGVMFYCQV